MTLTTSIYVCCLVLCDILLQVYGGYCPEYGHTCERGQDCCGRACCIKDNYRGGYGFRWSIWNMWYFWFIVIFILMSCFGGCGYWRRRQLMLHQQQSMLQHQQAYNHYITQAAYGVPSLSVPINSPYTTGPISNGGTQAEGTFPSPPAYNEVVTKPYVYPPSKDELPPYPGEYAPAYGIINAQQSDTGDGSVPGLPPYSVLPPDAINPAPPTSQTAASASSAQTPPTGPDAHLTAGPSTSSPPPPPAESPVPSAAAPVIYPTHEQESSDNIQGVSSTSAPSEATRPSC